MTDQNNSLININLKDLAEPAVVLIEKISDAIGGFLEPWQIRRIAQAEAEADKIGAISKIEITELRLRALKRFLIEESSKQNNIENITRKALPVVNSTAQPKNIENDWIVNFFDKARLISDEDMQELWARILAGEANAPGTYTKRTIYLLASLDKNDAFLFTKLCNFTWNIGVPVPLIFDFKNKLYEKNGIDFEILKHLDSIGLINFDYLSGYQKEGFDKTIKVTYGNQILILEFPKESGNNLDTGQVMFTNVGLQLVTICKFENVDGIIDYALNEWAKVGIKDINRT